MNTATRTRDDLITTYRTLARSLANEALTEAEAASLRRQMRDVQAEIDSHVAASA